MGHNEPFDNKYYFLSRTTGRAAQAERMPVDATKSAEPGEYEASLSAYRQPGLACNGDFQTSPCFELETSLS